MNSIYEVIGYCALVMSTPNYQGKILGVLFHKTQIEVSSFSGKWACFNYNNKTAYVRKMYLKFVGNTPTITTGSVTIKYVDAKTNSEVYVSKTSNNLPLGTHSYEARKISGYVISGPSTQTVTLTEETPNAEIIFRYNKLYGSVTIQYVDTKSNTKLRDDEKYTNLEFGSYTYSAKPFDDYNLIGNQTQTIIINDTNLNVVIVFEYEKIEIPTPKPEPNPDPEIPSDLNWNEVPYIATYYIKPIVKPNEEVFIDYYITDYYHKEYMENYNLKEDDWGDDNWTEEVWNNEIFTVTVRVEGQEDKVYPNLKAGDHQVSLGSFSAEGEQKFSIVCTDKYGRNSHELFNFFLVQGDVEVKEYVMTNEDLVTYNIKNTDNYEVKKLIDVSSLETKNKDTIKAELVKAAAQINPQSKTYVCVIADTDGDGVHNNWWGETQVVYASDYDKDKVLEEATNTRTGLQQLLDDKKAAGYNKLTLLPGKYRIDHQKQIYIPTNFTLDMNGATLKLNQFTGDHALMVNINNTVNSHVINGTLEGDYFSHDYANSPNNSEWPLGVTIGGEAKYSSFEDITIKDITGYGSGNGIENSRDGSLGYTHIYPRGIGNNFKLGDVDRNTGLDIESTTRTTCGYQDISGYSDIGYLSVSIYLGYQGNPCGTWNLICHFYDENKNYIKSVDAYQYRRVGVPLNAKYMRVTILNEAYPDNLSIQYFRIPTHCAFKNVKYENCRCVGSAPAAMKDMLMENCEFTNCGQSAAKCAFDAEDGWDSMQDCTFKSLKFNANPNNHFLTCAGHNFIIEGQQGGRAYIWERTRGLVVKNCKNLDLTIQGGGKDTIVRHGVYRVCNNTLTKASVANNLVKYNTSSAHISGLVLHSTMSLLGTASRYNHCTVKVSSSFLAYLGNISMINCEFIPETNFSDRYSLSFNNGHLDSYFFKDCKFKGKCRLSNHNGFFTGTFSNCSFDDVSIQPNVAANADDLILFENCDMNYTEDQFIRYSPHAYSTGDYSQIKFDSCTITNSTNNSTTFVYANSKPNGYCYFKNCTITLPSTITIFDGYPSYLENIKDFTITFENSPLPADVKLISDKFATGTPTKINII
nr:MAG TPA: glycoside hydrolase family protein [Caudoviricetes sp.]